MVDLPEPHLLKTTESWCLEIGLSDGVLAALSEEPRFLPSTHLRRNTELPVTLAPGVLSLWPPPGAQVDTLKAIKIKRE